MKKVFAFVLMFLASVAWAAPNSADYRINVHVVSSRAAIYYSDKYNSSYRILNVVIDGRKYELTDILQNSPRLIAPGDYKARFLNADDSSKHVMGRPEQSVNPQTAADPKTAYLILMKYELLYPDGKTEKFAVTGVTE